MLSRTSQQRVHSARAHRKLTRVRCLRRSAAVFACVHISQGLPGSGHCSSCPVLFRVMIPVVQWPSRQRSPALLRCFVQAKTNNEGYRSVSRATHQPWALHSAGTSCAPSADQHVEQSRGSTGSLRCRQHQLHRLLLLNPSCCSQAPQHVPRVPLPQEHVPWWPTTAPACSSHSQAQL